MSTAPIRRSPEEWDAFFYAIAQKTASLSKDPYRQVGALLVSPDRRQLSMGFNGFPPSVPDLPELLHDRDFKHMNMVHAEDNCLRQAPFPSVNCSIYVTCFPCLDCAKLLVSAGIRRLVAPAPDLTHHRWAESWQLAKWTLWTGGIDIIHPKELTDEQPLS